MGSMSMWGLAFNIIFFQFPISESPTCTVSTIKNNSSGAFPRIINVLFIYIAAYLIKATLLMETKSKRDEVIEIVHKLFIYTDYQQWDKLTAEVFKETVHFNMESLGAGPAKEMTATEICEAWKNGFAGIDAIHHQAGNVLVDFKTQDTEADVFCYAIASHFKNSATQGKTREFVGSYDLHLVFTDLGWRIDGFTYNLKYTVGNVEFK